MEDVFKIIDLLEDIRTRPRMYIGDDIQSLIPLIHGIRLTSAALGYRQKSDSYKGVIISRRWDYKPSMEIASQLLNQKLNYEEIVNGALLFEIDVWKASYNIDLINF